MHATTKKVKRALETLQLEHLAIPAEDDECELDGFIVIIKTSAEFAEFLRRTKGVFLEIGDVNGSKMAFVVYVHQ